MRRPGHEPTRRNRNQGTAKRGHGQDNRMGIPWPKDRYYYETLHNPVQVGRTIHGRDWSFLVGVPMWSSQYLCSVDDIVRVLELLPAEDLDGLETIVLRQPTLKQENLLPVWGRWCAFRKGLGARKRSKAAGKDEERGPDRVQPVLYLEAVRLGFAPGFPTRLRPEDERELRRLESDGFRFTSNKRGHFATRDGTACRATQLYRTLPHEVGHHVDYWRRVMQSAKGEPRSVWESLDQRYWSRPSMEREDFAHRYADEFRARMFSEGHFPFDPLVQEEQLERDGLGENWFLADLSEW